MPNLDEVMVEAIVQPMLGEMDAHPLPELGPETKAEAKIESEQPDPKQVNPFFERLLDLAKLDVLEMRERELVIRQVKRFTTDQLDDIKQCIVHHEGYVPDHSLLHGFEKPLVKDEAKVMEEIRASVREHCPDWYQLRTEFGFDPLDPDLKEQSLGKGVKYTRQGEIHDAYDFLLNAREGAIGINIAHQQRILGEFPDLTERLKRLFTAEIPKPFQVPAADAIGGDRQVTDQTGFDVLMHELTHEKQMFHVPLPGQLDDFLVSALNNLRLGTGIVEMQAHLSFGMTAAFVGPESVAEDVCYNYQIALEVMREVLQKRDELRKMSEESGKRQIAKMMAEHFAKDAKHELRKTKAAAVELDRLNTIKWLDSRTARQEEKPLPRINAEIGDLVRKAHYNDEHGWVTLQEAEDKWLKMKLGCRNQDELVQARQALDDMRDWFHAQQRIDFFQVQEIAQTAFAHLAGNYMGMAEGEASDRKKVWEQVCVEHINAWFPVIHNESMSIGHIESICEAPYVNLLPDGEVKKQLQLKLEMAKLARKYAHGNEPDEAEGSWWDFMGKPKLKSATAEKDYLGPIMKYCEALVATSHDRDYGSDWYRSRAPSSLGVDFDYLRKHSDIVENLKIFYGRYDMDSLRMYLQKEQRASPLLAILFGDKDIQ